MGGLLRKHDIVATGVATGVAGGLGMMFVLSIAVALGELSPLQPWTSIGESFAGAGESSGSRAVLGAAIHLATSAVFGVLLAALLPRELPTACAMTLGAGLALFAMGFMMSVVVPAVNPGFRESAQVIGGSWVVAHAVFGAIAGLAAPVRRWAAPEARGAPREGAPSRA